MCLMYSMKSCVCLPVAGKMGVRQIRQELEKSNNTGKFRRTKFLKEKDQNEANG